MTQDAINQAFARCPEAQMATFDTGPLVWMVVGAAVQVPGQDGYWRVSKILSGGRVVLTKRPIKWR